MRMQKLQYEVRFVTPAFLGNADQAGQWRTPPFKALLRQWWRVVRVNELLRAGCDHVTVHLRLRDEEGGFFGNAWLKDAEGRPDYCRSRVTVRLEHWNSGQMKSQTWPGGSMDPVVTTADGKGSVRADVYLGFGPVLPPSRKENRPGIETRDAIGSDEKDDDVLRLFTDEPDKLAKPVQLASWFGAIGSRCHNGWGSLSFEALRGTPRLASALLVDDELITTICQEWSRCLELDWPHALGTSRGQPLIWLSQPYDNWRKAMGCLANVRVEVRRAAKRFIGPSGIGGIHLLGYPAGGKWELPELKKGKPNHEEGRLATQLRFKVCAVPEGIMAMVFHVPHGFPLALRSRLRREQQDWLNQNEMKVWEAVHKTLNGMSRLRPIGNTK